MVDLFISLVFLPSALLLRGLFLAMRSGFGRSIASVGVVGIVFPLVGPAILSSVAVVFFVCVVLPMSIFAMLELLFGARPADAR